MLACGGSVTHAPFLPLSRRRQGPLRCRERSSRWALQREHWNRVQSGGPQAGEAIRHLYIYRKYVPAKGQMQGLPRAGTRHPTLFGGGHYHSGIPLTIHQLSPASSIDFAESTCPVPGTQQSTIVDPRPTIVTLVVDCRLLIDNRGLAARYKHASPRQFSGPLLSSSEWWLLQEDKLATLDEFTCPQPEEIHSAR